jgi:hypothetical protein
MEGRIRTDIWAYRKVNRELEKMADVQFFILYTLVYVIRFMKSRTVIQPER